MGEQENDLDEQYGIGSQLLKKMGFKPGQGLGVNNQGITEPLEVKRFKSLGVEPKPINFNTNMNTKKLDDDIKTLQLPDPGLELGVLERAIEILEAERDQLDISKFYNDFASYKFWRELEFDDFIIELYKRRNTGKISVEDVDVPSHLWTQMVTIYTNTLIKHVKENKTELLKVIEMPNLTPVYHELINAFLESDDMLIWSASSLDVLNWMLEYGDPGLVYDSYLLLIKRLGLERFKHSYLSSVFGNSELSCILDR